MPSPFEPSCHSCHPVPPAPQRKNRIVLVLCIAGGCIALALGGTWAWHALCTQRAEQEAATRRDQALLEAKARKDAAMLAEIGRKQEEASAKRQTATEAPPQGWTQEVKAK